MGSKNVERNCMYIYKNKHYIQFSTGSKNVKCVCN